MLVPDGSPSVCGPTFFHGRELSVLGVLGVAVIIGFMGPGSAPDLDLTRQPLSSLGRPPVVFEAGRGTVRTGPSGHKSGVSMADVVRVESTARTGCSGCANALTVLVDPTSLLLVGTTLAGLGVVLRRLWQRRAIGGQ